MRTVAIIQARMGSSRFPGKVLENLCGIPMLEVLLYRLGLVKSIDFIVVATTNNLADDVLVEWLRAKGIAFFRGEEFDVLDRFWNAAKKYQADIIVRITADDPLKDPSIIEKAIHLFRLHKDADYVSNTILPTFPEGLDVEVFSFSALNCAHKLAKLSSEREHVTPFIWKNRQKFSTQNFTMTPNLSHWRWTVDKPKDLEFMRVILAHFNNDIGVGFQEIINLIELQPELLLINSGTVRNEGYLKSIENERGS